MCLSIEGNREPANLIEISIPARLALTAKMMKLNILGLKRYMSSMYVVYSSATS